MTRAGDVASEAVGAVDAADPVARVGVVARADAVVVGAVAAGLVVSAAAGGIPAARD